MNAGLQVYNNNGIIQIDNRFKNIQFIDKITHVQTATSTTFGPNNTTNMTANTLSIDTLAKCLYAVRAENGKKVMWSEGYPYNSPVILQTIAEVGTQITIYRFSYASIPNGTCFEVRNESGELVFSDNGKFMRILDSRIGVKTTGFAPVNPGEVFSITNHSADIKTAVVQGNPCFQLDFSYYYNNAYLAMIAYMFNPESTVAQFMPYYYSSYGVGDVIDRSYDNNYNYLIVDVTGL